MPKSMKLTKFSKVAATIATALVVALSVGAAVLMRPQPVRAEVRIPAGQTAYLRSHWAPRNLGVGVTFSHDVVRLGDNYNDFSVPAGTQVVLSVDMNAFLLRDEGFVSDVDWDNMQHPTGFAPSVEIRTYDGWTRNVVHEHIVTAGDVRSDGLFVVFDIRAGAFMIEIDVGPFMFSSLHALGLHITEAPAQPTPPADAAEPPPADDAAEDAQDDAADISTHAAPSSWAAPFVNTAIARGLVPLHLQTYYIEPITRAEFASLAVALLETTMGSPIAGRASFADTTNADVEKMAYLGVVEGVGDDMFLPDDIITREQAALMLSRLAGYMDARLADNAIPIFADAHRISYWAADAVGRMQSATIMRAMDYYNNFWPEFHFTQEQAIVTTLRMFNEFGGVLPREKNHPYLRIGTK